MNKIKKLYENLISSGVDVNLAKTVVKQIHENMKLIENDDMVDVYLMNDDDANGEFAMDVLTKFFGKKFNESKDIVINTHYNDVGLIGTYPRTEAENILREVRKYRPGKYHSRWIIRFEMVPSGSDAPINKADRNAVNVQFMLNALSNVSEDEKKAIKFALRTVFRMPVDMSNIMLNNALNGVEQQVGTYKDSDVHKFIEKLKRLNLENFFSHQHFR